MEAHHPTLEQAGCRVGIGVATGADKAYIGSDKDLDVEALQTVLRSSLANAFVATYSLRMRGNCLRFQAQYLRRICIPDWEDVSATTRQDLIAASTSTDPRKIDDVVRRLYRLDKSAWQALSGS